MLKQYFIIILLALMLNISLQVSNDTQPYVKKNETQASVNKTLNLNNTASSTLVSTANIIHSEGGDTKIPSTNKNGQESVILPSVLNSNNTKTTTNSTTSNPIKKSNESAQIEDPLSENIEYHGDSKIKARKGVNITEEPIKSANVTISITNAKINSSLTSTSTTSTTTTTTPSTTTTFIPRKPTVTFGSDEEGPIRLPPKVFLNNKEIAPSGGNSSPSLLVVVGNRQFNKGPDYVLPIVLTILAVPLLAIILTVVYKRGSEWWYHRHYRRMDFLIDGMYNN